MATIGRIEEFREEKEDWDQYAERLDHFFAANGIRDADKNRSVFLAVIGKAYKQLHSLIAPMKPGETSYDDLKAAMKKHLTPAPSEIVQRFKFNSRFHRAGESVSSHVAELRVLAKFCNFGDSLEPMLHDRLVCGINNETTQGLLLAEPDLTYKKALEIATSPESASKNVQTLRGIQGHVGTPISQVPPVEPVHLVKTGKKLQTPPERKSKDSGGTCYRCGRGGHKLSQCKFLKEKCLACGKQGHIKHMCRSTRTQGDVKAVEDTSNTVVEQYQLYHLEEATIPESSKNPYIVKLAVEGKELQFEIDTGASLSLVSEEIYKELWSTTPLQATTVNLKTYRIHNNISSNSSTQ